MSDYLDGERKAAELTEALKDEKLSRKQLENQVSQMKEEMTDLKLSNETLEKVSTLVYKQTCT